MKHLRLFIVFIFLSSFSVLSQEDLSNDPTENPDANACFEGGEMEGKCNVDFDGNGIIEDFEVQWAWQCGWYMIRYEYDIYSRDEIPGACDTLLPSLPERIIKDNCYIWRNIGGYQISFLYKGPANARFNFLKFANLNCLGTPEAFNPAFLNEAIVFADTYPQAFAICQTLGAGQVAMETVPLSTYDASAAENAWYCTVRNF